MNQPNSKPFQQPSEVSALIGLLDEKAQEQIYEAQSQRIIEVMPNEKLKIGAVSIDEIENANTKTVSV